MSFQKRLDYFLHNHYHSRGGKAGTFIGVLAAASFAAGIVFSVREEGQGGTAVAVCALASLLLSVAGMIACMIGFREEDMFYLYAWIGSVLNGAVLVVLFCMFLIGV